MTPSTTYLTAEQVTTLHDRALQQFGGTPGIRDAGALASAVAQPAMEAFGTELSPTLREKAAAYRVFLARNHAFVDGSKCTRRTTSVAAAFLLMNGQPLPDDDDAIFTLVLDAAQGHLPDVRAVADRLESHLP